MNKNCYAIVNKYTNGLLLEDGKLPIYWKKSVAIERAKLFPDYRVETVDLKELHKFILTYPV